MFSALVLCCPDLCDPEEAGTAAALLLSRFKPLTAIEVWGLLMVGEANGEPPIGRVRRRVDGPAGSSV